MNEKLRKLVSDKEIAHALKISVHDISKVHKQVLEDTVCNILAKQVRDERVTIASFGVGEYTLSSDEHNKVKYYHATNKHLAISLPMQTNGKKYTGQHYDYYEGVNDLWD